MDNETKESLYVGKRFQWRKGDKTSKIETITEEIEKSGMPFLKFKSGSGIFVARLTEYFIEFNGDAKEADATNNIMNSAKPITKTLQQKVVPVNETVNETVTKTVQVKQTTHPLQGLLDLMKKRKVVLNLDSRTPNLSHFKMLIENYETDDILNLLVNNIYNEMVSDAESTKETIRTELKKLYKL